LGQGKIDFYKTSIDNEWYSLSSMRCSHASLRVVRRTDDSTVGQPLSPAQTNAHACRPSLQASRRGVDRPSRARRRFRGPRHRIEWRAQRQRRRRSGQVRSVWVGRWIRNRAIPVHDVGWRTGQMPSVVAQHGWGVLMLSRDELVWGHVLVAVQSRYPSLGSEGNVVAAATPIRRVTFARLKSALGSSVICNEERRRALTGMLA
jgi:hypothetical protein